MTDHILSVMHHLHLNSVRDLYLKILVTLYTYDPSLGKQSESHSIILVNLISSVLRNQYSSNTLLPSYDRIFQWFIPVYAQHVHMQHIYSVPQNPGPQRNHSQ